MIAVTICAILMLVVTPTASETGDYEVDPELAKVGRSLKTVGREKRGHIDVYTFLISQRNIIVIIIGGTSDRGYRQGGARSILLRNEYAE